MCELIVNSFFKDVCISQTNMDFGQRLSKHVSNIPCSNGSIRVTVIGPYSRGEQLDSTYGWEVFWTEILCLPQNSYVKILTPNAVVFGMGTLLGGWGGVNQVRWVEHQCCYKGDPRVLSGPSATWGHSEKTPSVTQEAALTRH